MVAAWWPLRKDMMLPPEVYLPQKTPQKLRLLVPKNCTHKAPGTETESLQSKEKFFRVREVLRSSKTTLLPPTHPPGAGELLHSEDTLCRREVGG